MIAIAGCGVNPMLSIYDDDAKIASASNTCSIMNCEQVQSDLHCTASVGKMEGMDTIWVLDAEEDTAVDITYRINVSSGKMKLVWIDRRRRFRLSWNAILRWRTRFRKRCISKKGILKELG